MGNLYQVLILLVAFKSAFNQLTKDKDKLLNWCLDSKSHKMEPGKEDELHQQCSPWKDHACCTKNVAINIHEINMYNFTFDPCPQKMSQSCRNYFNRDNCFYECEPSIGLWVVKTKRKIAKERFFNVPLCASECDAWFDACMNDTTCAYNWPRDFKFNKGENTCRENSTCISFYEMYKTSKNFCENVWDHSWKYTPDNKPCMHTWFDGSSGNPNKVVAEYYIKERFDPNTSSSLPTSFLLFVFIFLLHVF